LVENKVYCRVTLSGWRRKRSWARRVRWQRSRW